ncbi:hypothetical protein [Micromonospora sp. CPCC 205556]|uniref:hypothetical protein n=1 Tax=Micromonospora sp. CPCC 205556 TaxID=3122398 RepID=UPI002FEF747D
MSVVADRPVTGACARLRRWWLPPDPAGRADAHDHLLDGIALPRPFDLRRFVAQLARSRGRRLVVTVAPTRLPEPRAIWCRGADADHIVVGRTRSGAHRDHLVLHGVGHMLLGHQGLPTVAGPLADFLGPGTLDRLRGQLTRLTCTVEQERQAELFATRVQSLAARGLPASRPASAR